MKIAFFVPFFIVTSWLSAQGRYNSFENAIRAGNFKKCERIIKHQVHKHRKAHLRVTAFSSYHVYDNNILYLTEWLKGQEGILKVQTDQCAMKIALYPGWTDIGIRYRTHQDTVDFVYRVQEGKVLSRPLKSLLFRKGYQRNNLIYKSANRDSTFIDHHAFLCQDLKEQNEAKSLDFSLIKGSWKNSKNPDEQIQFTKDTLGSIHLSGLGPIIHFNYPKADNYFLAYGTAQSFVPQYVILNYDAGKDELQIRIEQSKVESRNYIFVR